MKKCAGFASVAGIIIAVAVAALLGIATYSVIDGNAKKTDFNKYNFYSIIEPTVDNGYIGDHVKGSKDAPVLIFEYADYQCPGCASINPKVNAAIEATDGKVAVVYRSFLLSYHQNGTAAASAAESAGKQGYWKAYANMLFAKQAEWEYADASERTELFNNYFIEVTDGEGDLDKFNQDLASKEASKKISFDMGIGQRIDVGSTPAFYVDGQLINWRGAGSIIINGKTIEWETSRSAEEDLIQLFKDIAEAKLAE